MNNDLITIKEAVNFISENFNREISVSNVSYLIKYGQLHKYGENGETLLAINEIKSYYEKINNDENYWKSQVGNDLDWELSFSDIKEYERTKHVHRLHPYKGKFIPQLVDYFLNDKTNGLKKEVFFNKGDIVIDPFCGSGTTLVQANELGIHAVGIDISEFNALMTNIKVGSYDLIELQKNIISITTNLRIHIENNIWGQFDNELSSLVSDFNKVNFPTPEILYRIKRGEINLAEYSKEKELNIRDKYLNLLKQFSLNIREANSNGSFINKWFTPSIKFEILFLLDQINKVKDINTRQVLQLILSRTVRTCRATTHSDLATLIEPVLEPYYCFKHNKICKPLFSIANWWDFYSKDTVKRLSEFSKIRTETNQTCVVGDSKSIDLHQELKKSNELFWKKFNTQKVKGIFTSPPYVGLIDYHEQHAYAYELFGIPRRDELEIGSQNNGKGKAARDKYINDISDVLINMRKYLVADFEIFIVANDSYGLYPIIAEKSNLRIVNEFRRPVLNRTEKDKNPYSEKIFRMKDFTN